MNMLKAIQVGVEAAVAADPRPLAVKSEAEFVSPAPRKATSACSAPKPVPSRTMAAIARAVESLPPFPLSAPLPILGTANQYADRPCDTPKPRYMPKGTCRCGFLMGEHQKGGAK
jgi:hypothetical protein